MKLLAKLAENIWLSVTSVGLGLVFATHYDTVRATLAKAAADPFGALDVALFLLGVTGLAVRFLEAKEHNLREEEKKRLAGIVIDSAGKVALLLVASNGIPSEDVKHKLIETTEELRRSREALSQFFDSNRR